MRAFLANNTDVILIGIFLALMLPVGVVSGYLPFLIIGMIVVYLIIKRSGIIDISNSFILLVLWEFIYSVISYFVQVGGSVLEPFRRSMSIFMPFLIIQLGKNLIRLNREKLISIILVFMTIEAIVGVLQSRKGFFSFILHTLYNNKAFEYLNMYSRYQSIGTYGNPNEYGIGMVSLLLIVLFLASGRGKKTYAIIIAGAAILSSQSRTAAVVAAMIVVIYFLTGNLSTNEKIIGGMALVMAVPVCLWLYQTIVNREISIAGMGKRFLIWQDRWQLLSGLDSMRYVITFLFGRGVAFCKSLGAFDNEYVFIFISSGLVGCLMYLVYLYKLYRCINKIKDAAVKNAGRTLLFVWFVCGITTQMFLCYTHTFWFFIFFGYAAALQAHPEYAQDTGRKELCNNVVKK